jgi:large subunit ribosomal protein L9
MEVLLRKAIDKLGEAGDIVQVAKGYARNYLFPHKLATPVTDDNLRSLEAEKRKAQREAERHHEALVAFARKLDSASCTVTAQATDSGHLFGSVSAAQIVEALAAEGFTVDEKTVHLEQPIKETGVYAVEIHLAPDVIATARVWVVAD